jgi:aminoglycoside phosphotransferase family enzyme
MELVPLIEALSRAAAYSHPVGTVEVRHTHISVVFLAGPFVYKVKKPVNLGFVDFSTLEKRRHFCDKEVRLNRRLAPDVYLGVVPVTKTGSGLKFEEPGEVVE